MDFNRMFETYDLLERVAMCYQKSGFELSYFPSIVFVKRIPHFSSNNCAEVFSESELMSNLLDFICETSLCLKGRHDLVDGKDSSYKSVHNLLDQFLMDENGKPTIIVYSSFFQGKTKNEQESILMHKFHHLLELERGLLDETPFIAEGTATCATELYSGQTFSIPLSNCRNFVELFHSGCADLIKQSIMPKDIIAGMMDLETRLKIQDVFLNYITNNVDRIIAKREKILDSYAEKMAQKSASDNSFYIDLSDCGRKLPN